MKLGLKPDQLQVLKQMFDRIARLGEKIASEMKRANDLKKKEVEGVKGSEDPGSKGA